MPTARTQVLPESKAVRSQVLSESYEQRWINLQRLHDTDQQSLRQNEILIRNLNQEVLTITEKLAIMETSANTEKEDKNKYMVENCALRQLLQDQVAAVEEGNAAVDELVRLKIYHEHEEGFMDHIKGAMTDGFDVQEELIPWCDSIRSLNASQSLQICLMTFVRLPVAEQSIFYTEALSRLQNKKLLTDLEKKVKFMVI